jgi:hypothetical protein
MDGKNDITSRPLDGKIDSPNQFPFRVPQQSKTESFSILEQQTEKARQRNGVIDDRDMENFLSGIEGKSTTNGELAQAIAVTKQWAKHPEILSEAAQSRLMDIPQVVANHRNADYPIQRASRDIVSEAATSIPALSDEAQKKFFNNVAYFANSDPKGKWSVDITENIANSASQGVDTIAETAKSQYIGFLGQTASKISSMDAQDQERFQESAIKMMQETKFPYKFDADSLREALSVVPDNVRSKKYEAQLNALEKNLMGENSAVQVAKTSEVSPAHEIPTAVVIPEEKLRTLENKPESAAPRPESISRDSAAQAYASPEGQLPYVILENVRPKSPEFQGENLDEDTAPHENIMTAKAE